MAVAASAGAFALRLRGTVLTKYELHDWFPTPQCTLVRRHNTFYVFSAPFPPFWHLSH